MPSSGLQERRTSDAQVAQLKDEVTDLKNEVKDLKENVASLTKSVEGLVEAWTTAKGITAFVKWVSGTMLAFAAIVATIKGLK